MTSKYHINPTTGNPGVCNPVKTGKCKYGKVEHFSSKEEARESYEQKMKSKELKLTMDSISPELAEAIEYECERQHVDEAHRQFLLDGWAYAKGQAESDEPLTKESFLKMAIVIEPDSRGVYRQTPVTFASGGYAVPPQQVEASMTQLIRFWPGKDATDEDKRYWLKECLVTHCLTDGNGRSAWVLQQWLYDTWDKPERLIDFHF